MPQIPALNLIGWREVESSNIESVGWLRQTFESEEPRMLFVKFKDGTVYAYTGVTRQRAVALTRAKSAGKYLNEQIKPNYKAVRIG